MLAALARWSARLVRSSLTRRGFLHPMPDRDDGHDYTQNDECDHRSFEYGGFRHTQYGLTEFQGQKRQQRKADAPRYKIDSQYPPGWIIQRAYCRNDGCERKGWRRQSG